MISCRNAVAAAIVLILWSASALAQSRMQFVEYSAKFLCGVVEEQAPTAAPVRRPRLRLGSADDGYGSSPIPPVSVTVSRSVI